MAVATLDVPVKCRTDVFVSVFCDVRVLYEEPGNEVSGAVQCYAVVPSWKSNFILVEKAKVFQNNVSKAYSLYALHSIFIIFEISYTPVYTKFRVLATHLFAFFIFLPPYGIRGFKAYLHAKHYFAIFFNYIWNYV